MNNRLSGEYLSIMRHMRMSDEVSAVDVRKLLDEIDALRAELDSAIDFAERRGKAWLAVRDERNVALTEVERLRARLENKGMSTSFLKEETFKVVCEQRDEAPAEVERHKDVRASLAGQMGLLVERAEKAKRERDEALYRAERQIVPLVAAVQAIAELTLDADEARATAKAAWTAFENASISGKDDECQKPPGMVPATDRCSSCGAPLAFDWNRGGTYCAKGCD